MAAPLLLLLLVLVAPVMPSHYYGGRSSVKSEQRSDGTWKVKIHNRATFDGCSSHHWSCHTGNCGTRSSSSYQRNLDFSTNAPSSNSRWCESESRMERTVQSNRPFSMRAASCCWIPTRRNVYSWRLLTTVDLGQRSDTNKPNNSPNVAVLPFLRVPQNCPRTFRLSPTDPDDDHVRCRHGTLRYVECNNCNRHSEFWTDPETCTFGYRHSTADSRRVFAFEMVSEDFPRAPVMLAYTDGSNSTRFPVHWRGRRSLHQPWWLTSTMMPANPAWAQTARPWWWTTTPLPRANTPWWMNPRWHITAAPVTTPHWWHQFRTTRPRWLNPQTTRTTLPPTTVSPTGNTQPLSKVPLQFSVLVDPAVSSCRYGDFIPLLLPPTPRSGARVHAEVDSVLEIRVKARASMSTISDIIFSGPVGMTKTRLSQGGFVLRWSPTSDDLREKVPVCFAVESSLPPRVVNPYNPSSSPPQIYQSEMRCVVVAVEANHIRSEVTCTESTMTVAIEKASLPGLRVDHVKLSDPANVVCSFQPRSNHTHIVASFPLNACGTQIEEDNVNLKFKNEVTSVDNQTDLITRKHLLQLDFFCVYPKHGNVTLGFRTHRENVTVTESGFGTFTYNFEFYTGSSYRAMISPSSYPVEVDVGSRIYMKIQASSTVNNTELFVESCRASPYDNPNYTPTYSIIENGCPVDQTVQIHTRTHPDEFRFSMEAFKFIGLHDQVYISCSVIVCEHGNRNTRCARGCISSSQHYRRRREAAVQTANHFISQGPLRLRRSAEEPARSDVSLNLNMNMVFMVGAVLAAVAMFTVTSYLKKRISTVKYQPLKTEEH